jgi:hypothetical protein
MCCQLAEHAELGGCERRETPPAPVRTPLKSAQPGRDLAGIGDSAAGTAGRIVEERGQVCLIDPESDLGTASLANFWFRRRQTWGARNEALQQRHKQQPATADYGDDGPASKSQPGRNDLHPHNRVVPRQED